MAWDERDENVQIHINTDYLSNYNQGMGVLSKLMIEVGVLVPDDYGFQG